MGTPRLRAHRVAAIVLVGLTSWTVTAQEPDELLRRAVLFGGFEDLQSTVEMEIHDGGSKTRILEIFVKHVDDDYRALVRVVSPPFLNRMKFLSISSGNRTDQWISTSRGSYRVAEGSETEPLFDSDFTVEDFSDSDPDDYSLTKLPDQTVDGEPCHVIDVIPEKVETDYARRRVFLSQADQIIVRAEYYDDEENLIRLFELHERMTLDGAVFPKQATMRTLAAETHTLLTVEEVDTDARIPRRYFNPGSL
ncbi:MAG: outer membrane lipoprotein-sorting protein [Spirochaetota bacterium]